MWLAIIVINLCYSDAMYMGGYFQGLKVVLEAKMILWAYILVV